MDNHKVLLLGLGMQGKAALYDLAQSEIISEIIVGDVEHDLEFIENLPNSNKVQSVKLDVSEPKNVARYLGDVDIIVDLLPSRLAFPIGPLAVDKGVNLVTTTRYNLNPVNTDQDEIKARQEMLDKMNNTAIDKNIRILTQFGLDPGLDLILSLSALEELDEVSEFYSYGAGIPEYQDANNPIKYKFSWSVEGVLKAYQRSARIIKNGEVVDIPANDIFAAENMHTLKVDELDDEMECYCNGDVMEYAEQLGIRDKVNHMARYTGRWPGHRAFWEPFIKCGFLSKEPVEVDENQVDRRKFVANLLSSQEQFWYGENERDIAFIRMDARGRKNGKKVRNIYQLIDKRDLETGFTAMQRTVGFTASIGVQLILNNEIEKYGMLSPFDVRYEYIADELEDRGMKVTHKVMPD